ncbi:iron-containing redox enzyme family protein [Spongisporangium articulatum]|uniref:Iron-containing redox enzyme family protein n=1 Tax=Spongisporangium articulatum TaxID=3362603 RepID=A0ABW8ALC7_9ACTN
MTTSASMPLPAPRGSLSHALITLLRGAPDGGVRLGGDDLPSLIRLVGIAEDAAAVTDGPVEDDDVQLSLALLYELHYRGLDGVDPRWEWQPQLTAVAAVLERVLLAELRDRAAARLAGAATAEVTAETLPENLSELIAADDTPSLSTYLARTATSEQYAEFLAHRSVYHLREADPHTFAIPRLAGRPKAALVEVQSDEYGGGAAERMHSALFAQTMRTLGVNDRYGAHVDVVPAVTLAWSNAMTLFGLHRHLRGAVAGHLAVLEMTSSLPNRLYGNGLRRLGFDAEATLFFDEHVEADAVHEQIAAHDLAAALAADEPALLPDVLLGAATALELDGLVVRHLLDSWAVGGSSLRGRTAVVRSAAQRGPGEVVQEGPQVAPEVNGAPVSGAVTVPAQAGGAVDHGRNAQADHSTVRTARAMRSASR